MKKQLSVALALISITITAVPTTRNKAPKKIIPAVTQKINKNNYKISKDILTAINASKKIVYDTTLEHALHIAENDLESAKKHAFKKSRNFYNAQYKKAIKLKDRNTIVYIALDQLDEKDNTSPIANQY